MTGITCILISTGRLDKLRESIAAFVAQDHAEKELMVFNTCYRQSLNGDIPGVTFVNSKAPIMPMRAKNLCVENAKYETIVLWSEVDYYTPAHLSRVAEKIAGRDWVFFDQQFQSNDRRHIKIESGSDQCFAFTKKAWAMAGGFQPGINGADDRNFIARVTKACVGEKVATPGSQITFVRVGNDYEREACKPSITSGKIKIEPATTRDFASQISQYLSGKQDSRVCVVELGRYGDIINILPFLKMIADAYDTPHLCVAAEFADILDGVSYVKPFIFHGKNEDLGSAIATCKNEFNIVINAQIWGRGHVQQKTENSYNRQSWASCGISSHFYDTSLRPYFDQRNTARESVLLAQTRGEDRRPMLLVNVGKAVSSPCDHCAALLDEIKKHWLDYHVVDLSAIRAERLYDMLVLLENARAIVSIDTSYLHLAAATNIPVVAIVNPKDWAGTEVRFNLAFKTDYDKILENPKLIHEGISCATCKGQPQRVTFAPVGKPKSTRVIHLVDIYDEQDQKVIDREQAARNSWDELYANSQLMPVHVSEYPRNARGIGDSRALPYLKDLLRVGIESTDGNDVILWTNTDTILHPQIVEYAKFHCSVYGACSFFRTDFLRPVSLDLTPENYARHSRAPHIGRDAFAFNREWLVQNWNQIPDAILGAVMWDIHLACLIRLTFGIKSESGNLAEQIFPAEAPRGYTGHLSHNSAWNVPNVNEIPSNKHNGKLFLEFAKNCLPNLRVTPEGNLG